MAKEKISGIYCIENIINGKKYIGQSVNINARWSGHISYLRRNVHSNIHLQRAWNKYKEHSFKFKIIETCSIEDLDDREQYYINIFDTYKNGYNRDLGGVSNKKYPVEFGRKISKTKLNKSIIEKIKLRDINIKAHEFESDPIYQINFEGKIIKRWSSARRAGKELNYNQSCIWNCLRKMRKTYKKSIWIYVSEYDDFNLLDYYNTKAFERKVYQFDIEGNLISTYAYANEVSKYGYDASAVLKCCNGKYKTHSNCIWSFNDIANKNIVDYIKRHSQIKVYDMNMNYLFSTRNQKEASLKTDVCVASISMCVNNKRESSKGFIFKFAS